MEIKVNTLSGLVLYACMTQADFYRGSVLVEVDNPKTGEVFPSIEMDPEVFADLADLMEDPDYGARQGPKLRPVEDYYEPIEDSDIIEVRPHVESVSLMFRATASGDLRYV